MRSKIRCLLLLLMLSALTGCAVGKSAWNGLENADAWMRQYMW